MIGGEVECDVRENHPEQHPRKRRCIVPVDGFFEWRAIKGRRAKQPYAIAMKDGAETFSMGFEATFIGRSGQIGF